jgi:drug/metabolite transporter (DMT)-like permease
LCIVSGAGFATLSILAKLAFAAGLSLPVMLGLRFTGAAAVLLLVLLLRRSEVWLGWRRSAMLLALGGIGYAGQSTLYFSGLLRVPASLSSVLLYVYPAFVALLGWAVAGRRPNRSTIAALAITLGGVVLTVGGGSSGLGRVDPLGAVFVLASAATYAVYIVTSHGLVPQGGALVATFWIATGAGLSFLTAAALGPELRAPIGLSELALVAAMSLFSTALPLTTFLAGMARVGPTAAALLSTLEPVFTVGLAALFLGESLSVRQVLGAVLVLAAIVLLQAFELRGEAHREGLHN